VAPYNGLVAVTKNRYLSLFSIFYFCIFFIYYLIINNSFVWKEGSGSVSKEIIDGMARECEVAARVVDARAPIRIDCRVSKHGKGVLFDLSIPFFLFSLLSCFFFFAYASHNYSSQYFAFIYLL
jgi:hypothetical protein